MVNEKFIVLTISDTCSSGANIDKSGPKLVECIKEDFTTAIIRNEILPDDKDLIAKSLIYYSDVYKAHVILTTGGTGFSCRDVTPEATRKVIDKTTDGISIALMTESLKITPMAMTSRLISGIRNKTLIINFPGSVKAVSECYNIIKTILRHSIDLLNDEMKNVKVTHSDLQTEPKATIGGCGHNVSHCSKVGYGYKERNSPYPMIEVDDAMKLIKNHFNMDPTRQTFDYKKLMTSLGFVTSHDIVAESPHPPFDASIKDGYACLSIDGTSDRIVRDEVAAGDNPSIVLKSGECVFINTGAPIPAGADCVIQIEDTKLIEYDGAKEQKIGVLVAPVKGQDIRLIGSDIKQGEIVIPQGTEIGPAEIGLLASLGRSKVRVFGYPYVIGILSTGNELKPVNTVKLENGQIRDSNKSMIMSLFKQHVECWDFGTVIDDPIKIKEAIERAFATVTVLITTGGVSMGDKDYLKSVLVNDFGANIVFGRLNMKPGKPTTFATCVYKERTRYIFALPGNPVSALVTSQLIVMPSLLYWRHIPQYELTKLNVMLNERVELDPRPHYARAFITHQPSNYPLATLTGNQISSRLMSSSGADVLLILPGSNQNRKHLDKSELVEALLLKS